MVVINVAVGSIASVILWTITAGLIAGVGRKKFGFRHLSLVGGMLGVFLLMAAMQWNLTFLHNSALKLLAAYVLATLASLFSALYQYAHRKGPRAVIPDAILTARCLAWAAGSGLIVAYAFNDPWTLLAVGICALVFFALCPALAFFLAGSIASDLSRSEQARALFEKGLQKHPDSEMRTLLQMKIAAIHLVFAQGGAALKALEGIEALTAPLRSVPYGQPIAPMPSIAVLNGRAAALIHLERFDDALTCCEQMLQAPADDPLGNNRLLLVHIRLAELARRRGWADELLAQVDCSLRMVSKTNRKFHAYLRYLRASALIAAGKLDGVEAECNQALEMSRDASVEARVGVVRAQLAMIAGDIPTAERETEKASRLLGDNLEVAYWRGKALVAAGRKEEGTGQLLMLARNYPQEYWGRMAGTALAPSASATA